MGSRKRRRVARVGHDRRRVAENKIDWGAARAIRGKEISDVGLSTGS
jgi:hypothetical protein